MSKSIDCIVTITEVATGESVEHKTEWNLDPDSGYEYMWSEGNYACDCNRGLFFLRAKGEDPELLSTECGEEKFKVKVHDLNGNLLYEDE